MSTGLIGMSSRARVATQEVAAVLEAARLAAIERNNRVIKHYRLIDRMHRRIHGLRIGGLKYQPAMSGFNWLDGHPWEKVVYTWGPQVQIVAYCYKKRGEGLIHVTIRCCEHAHPDDRGLPIEPWKVRSELARLASCDHIRRFAAFSAGR